MTMTPSDVSAKRLLTEGVQVVRERIAVRAYALYVERGGSEGKALDDWLRAESEILAPEVMAEAARGARRALRAKARGPSSGQGAERQTRGTYSEGQRRADEETAIAV
jgi:hypothetical protein